MAEFPAVRVHPGDVVVADFPGITGTKRRPALVVSTDVYHTVRPDVVLGLLTGQIAAATSATDYRLQDWAVAGLRTPTAFRTFLITLPHRCDRCHWSSVPARLGRSARPTPAGHRCLTFSLPTPNRRFAQADSSLGGVD